MKLLFATFCMEKIRFSFNKSDIHSHVKKLIKYIFPVYKCGLRPPKKSFLKNLEV